MTGVWIKRKGFGLLRKTGEALRGRRGAVTVDWLVLTAALVVLVFGIVGSMSDEFNQIWASMWGFVDDNTGF